MTPPAPELQDDGGPATRWLVQVRIDDATWITVGPPCATKAIAQGWRPFAKAAWHTRRSRVVSSKSARLSPRRVQP